jgi:hypothetical protein
MHALGRKKGEAKKREAIQEQLEAIQEEEADYQKLLAIEGGFYDSGSRTSSGRCNSGNSNGDDIVSSTSSNTAGETLAFQSPQQGFLVHRIGPAAQHLERLPVSTAVPMLVGCGLG